MAFDILIKNGTVIDGTGGKARSGTIAISGKMIEAIDPGADAKGAIEINAEGRIVAPGFIDCTNHSDTTGTLFSNPSMDSMLHQGVTTIIGGNCGSSLAPLLSQESLEGLQKWRTDSLLTTDWRSMGEFLHSVEKIKPGVNFGSFVGLGTLLRGVLSGQHRDVETQDVAKLNYALSEALKEGAFGLSTGLVYAHERSMSTERIADVARTLKKEGGLYKTHLRSESGYLLGAISEALAIGREAEVPVHISHFKAIGRKAWKNFSQSLALIEHASAAGQHIRFDAYPYVTTGSFLYLLLPPGAYQGGFRKLFERLKDPELRTNILEALMKKTLHYDAIIVSTAWKTKESVGKSIQEIAERIGISPEEVFLQLLLANEGRITIFGRTVKRDQVQRALEHPLSVIASDGSGYPLSYKSSGELVHPRSFSAFPRFFRLAVHTWKTLSWEDAVRKATSAPAEILGLKKRGTLKKGNFADIVIFNPETLKSNSTFQNPYQYPSGIEYVIVNGRIVLAGGKIQETRSGMVLKRNDE